MTMILHTSNFMGCQHIPNNVCGSYRGEGREVRTKEKLKDEWSRWCKFRKLTKKTVSGGG